LDEALKTAVDNAFNVRIAKNRVEKSARQVRQAKGAFGPNVVTQGSYTRFDGTLNSTGSQSSQVSSDSKTLSLSLTQPIDISGLSRKALQAVESQTHAAEAGLDAEINSIRQKVKAQYYGVLLAAALVSVQESSLSSAQARYDKAVIREQEGAIPKFDVLRFLNEVRKSEQALTLAQGNLVTAKQVLNSLLARPVETEFEAESIDMLPELPEDVGALVVVALRSRPEVLQSRYGIDALGKLADVQAFSFAPQLNIQAIHTRNLDPGVNQTTQATQGGINLSVPLFDSGITKAKVDAARSDTDQAKVVFEQLLLSIALEVQGAYTTAFTAKKNYVTALDSERLAKEALRLAETRYNEGAGLLIDIVQAQADLTAASGNVQNAKYQFLTAFSDIQRAVGSDNLTNQEKP
jgi:outer membrane protein TolC